VKPGVLEVSFAAQACAPVRCLNDGRDGVTQSLPNPLNRPTSFVVPGIRVGGVPRLAVAIRFDPAIKDTGVFFPQHIGAGSALTRNLDNVD
jgi:hypothetical protein